MTPILDPRNGDIEDDASSTKRRSMLSLAGSLLAEISLPKLAIAWMLLIGFPGLLLGAAPLLVSIWIAAVWSHAANIFYEILPVLLLPPLMAIGWFGGRPLLRLAESSFWSLNALAVQPAYIVFREGIRHLAEQLLASRIERGPPRLHFAQAPRRHRVSLICGLGLRRHRSWCGPLRDGSAAWRILRRCTGWCPSCWRTVLCSSPAILRWRR